MQWILLLFFCASLAGMHPPEVSVPPEETSVGRIVNNIMIGIGITVLFTGSQMVFACSRGPATESCLPFSAVSVTGAAVTLGGLLSNARDGAKETQLVTVDKIKKWIKRHPQPLFDGYIDGFLAKTYVCNPDVYAKVGAHVARDKRIRKMIHKNNRFKPGGWNYRVMLKLPLPVEIVADICARAIQNEQLLQSSVQSLRSIPLTKKELESLLNNGGELTGCWAAKDPTHAHDGDLYCKGIVEIDGKKVCNSLTTAYIRLRAPYLMCGS